MNQNIAQEQPVINIQGEKVALGPMRRDLAPLYHRWMNDVDTLRRGGYPIRPRTMEQQYASLDRGDSDASNMWFTIYDVTNWQPVGTCGLMDIDRLHSCAEFGITIAEPGARGKGFGTEAARLILDMAFIAIGLHSVFLTTSEHNIAGQKAYAKAGFKEIGRRRQCDMIGGKLYDLIYMDILADEFASPVLAKLFAPDKPRS